MIRDPASALLPATLESGVNIYAFYIHDDRYSVPTIDFFLAPSDDDAKRKMGDRLGSSPHYFAIELWQGDRIVAKLCQSAVPDRDNPAQLKGREPGLQ